MAEDSTIDVRMSVLQRDVLIQALHRLDEVLKELPQDPADRVFFIHENECASITDLADMFTNSEEGGTLNDFTA